MFSYIIFFCSVLFSFNIYANDIDLNAKEILLNKDEDIIAKDNITLNYEDHYLEADFLKYSKKNNSIAAKNNIKYFNKLTGEKILAAEILTTSDFSSYSLKNSLLILPNNHSYSAEYIKKENNITAITNGSYTSCSRCDGKNYKRPKWKISAKSIKIKENSNNIRFYNSFFNIYDIPVLYIPYFVYPKVKEKKKSGFLRAEYDNNSLYGDIISLPIFFNLAPNYDLTYTPRIYTKVNNIHNEIEFRHISKQSKTNVNLFFIRENKQMQNLVNENYIQKSYNNKWLINIKSQRDISEKLSLDMNIFEISDKIFNERYYNNFHDYYNSEISFGLVEKNKSFIISSAKYTEFEANKIDRDDFYHLPSFSFWNNKKVKYNYTATNNINFKSLKYDNQFTRDNLNYSFALSKDFLLASRVATKISFTNDLRIYHNDISADNKLYLDSNPQIILRNKYPLYHKGRIKHILTPELNLFIATKNNNSDQVTNISSSSSRLNHNNINSGKVINGDDLFVDGTRISYALDDLIKIKSFSLRNYIGQLYFFEEQNLERESGFKKGFSDIVGKLSLIVTSKLQLSYNYKLRNNDYNPYHQYYDIKYNNTKFSASIGYTKYKYHLVDSKYLGYIDYISTNLNYRINDIMRIAINHDKNLLPRVISDNSGSIRSSVLLKIDDDCVVYDIGYNKEYISNSYMKANHSFTFNITLKK